MKFWATTVSMREVSNTPGKGRVSESSSTKPPTPTCEFAFLDDHGSYVVIWWKDPEG